jgi:heptosyltransferase-2
MGDNIITLPAIASIKEQYPNIKIIMLTNAGGENLVSIESLIDKSYIEEFINYTGKSKLDMLKMLKNKKYDLIIDLTQPSSLLRTMRNMIVFRFLGIDKSIGWNVSELSFFRKKQDDFNMVGSELQKYLSYLEDYSINTKRKFILDITEKEIDKIDNIINQYELKDKKLIAIVVGSKRVTNRWSIEYFNETIKYILHNTDYIPIIIGGKEDNKLVEKLSYNKYNFCGKLTPLESAELFKRCKFTISNDTGPMHLSYAVGTKVIALFSARGFRKKWYPPKDMGIILRDDRIECRLCYAEKCEHLSCLKNIRVEEVIKQIKEKIKC